MKKGHIYVYHGAGRGKTTLAIGQGMRVLGNENTVIMIQFLNTNDNKEFLILKRLEPDFRVFKFGEYPDSISKLTEEHKNEIKNDIASGFIFLKKIIETGECDMLILDGVMDAVKEGFLDEKLLSDVLIKKDSYMDIIVTGNAFIDKVGELADFIYTIKTEKFTE